MKEGVLGLGAAAMDLVLQCESLPAEDGFAFVHSEHLLSGGSCANVLVTLSNLGVETNLVAKLGDDHYGAIFTQELAAAGVKTNFISVREGGTTLHTFITVAPNGSRSIFAHLGDSLFALEEAEVFPEMLQGIRAFYADMLPGKPALKLARICRQEGIPVVFNLECPPSFMNVCGVKAGEIEEMISLAALVISSREGFMELAHKNDYPEAFNEVYKRFHPRLGMICTGGDQGAVWLTNEGLVAKPAFAVDAVDTTGAGDAFTGGLIYGIFYQNMDRPKAIEFASACAAIKCTQLGARLKARESDVTHFIQTYENR